MVELARGENRLQAAKEFVSPRFGNRRGMAFEPGVFCSVFCGTGAGLATGAGAGVLGAGIISTPEQVGQRICLP